MIRIVTLAVGMLSAGAQPGEARHSDSGYGVQGGVNPVYSGSNVFSGIYGLDYTYAREGAREGYDFNRPCPGPDQAVVTYLLTCRYGYGEQ